MYKDKAKASHHRMKMCCLITCLQGSRTTNSDTSTFKLTQSLYYKFMKYKLITLSTQVSDWDRGQGIKANVEASGLRGQDQGQTSFRR